MVYYPAIEPPSDLTAELLPAYLATEYRVRLSYGGYVGIHIGQPLPQALAKLADGCPWSFISAWNPHSQINARHANRLAQRHLLAALRTLQPTHCRAGMGVGAQGWREASLFVVGPKATALHSLALRFAQLAWVGGAADRPARLYWSGLDPKRSEWAT